jgi:hypothetical protein
MKPVNTKSPRMSFHLMSDAQYRVEKAPQDMSGCCCMKWRSCSPHKGLAGVPRERLRHEEAVAQDTKGPRDASGHVLQNLKKRECVTFEGWMCAATA